MDLLNNLSLGFGVALTVTNIPLRAGRLPAGER